MKNKMILVLSGLIVVNTVLGKVGGEEDVFETKDVFGSNEAQRVHQEKPTTNKEVKEEPTITNDELKVQEVAHYRRGKYFWVESTSYLNSNLQEGMDQYIVVNAFNGKRELDKILTTLRPLYTDKAKKLGKKPIIFKYQRFEYYNEVCIEAPIEETDEFSIESFRIGQYCNNTDEFGKFYNALIKYNKPIVFEHVKATYKDEIEKKYDLSNCKINSYFAFVSSFDEYLKLKKLGIENLRITIRLDFNSIPAKEFRKQFYLYKHDKQVGIWLMGDKRIGFGFYGTKIPVECLPLTLYTIMGDLHFVPIFNPQDIENILFVECIRGSIYIQDVECDTLIISRSRTFFRENVSCKTIIYLGSCNSNDLIYLVNRFLDRIKNLETIYLWVSSKDLDKIKEGKYFTKYNAELSDKLSKRLLKKNISLRFCNAKKLWDYTKYSRDKDTRLIFGYVNVKNKPDELSDEEWKQVLVLKQKAKEIIKEIQSESIKSPELEEINKQN